CSSGEQRRNRGKQSDKIGPSLLFQGRHPHPPAPSARRPSCRPHPIARKSPTLLWRLLLSSRSPVLLPPWRTRSRREGPAFAPSLPPSECPFLSHTVQAGSAYTGRSHPRYW